MAENELRNALSKLIDDFIETPTDRIKAIAALYDQAEILELQIDKEG